MTDFYRGNLAAPHGFFTRTGGTSTGAYASLNCGLYGHDDPDRVVANRSRAARAIGADPSHLVGVKQIHGARVIHATAPWPGGTGPEADAIVTSQPDVALGIITADCAPVLFADITGRIIGAAHAGWRGALAGVLEATAAAMRDLGAEAITAVIGPCIQQASYEVGLDLRDAIIGRAGSDARFFIRGEPNHWQFDLAGYATARLSAAGVESVILPHDTFADETLFFSHRRRIRRREIAGGHQISIVRSAA